MNWQKEEGYNQSSLIKTQIGRGKATIGGSLQARIIDNQITETRLPAKILNRMTVLGKAQFEPVP